MNKTIWLPVVGYEGRYLVSAGACVKSLHSGKRMKTFKNEDDYICLYLRKDGKIKKHKLHRLVAIAHLPNPDNLPDVNHKFGKKWDCRASQIEWMTKSANIQHSYDTGLRKSNAGKTYKIKTHGKYQTQKRRRDTESNRKSA